MNTYFIRCLPADWPLLLSIGQKLGAIAVDGDNVTATQGGAWDFIGTIYSPTGEIDEEGNDILTSVKDNDGNEYIHINLITEINLGEKARAMSTEHPEIAGALLQLGKFFLLDADGNAKAPAHPARKFAGA